MKLLFHIKRRRTKTPGKISENHIHHVSKLIFEVSNVHMEIYITVLHGLVPSTKTCIKYNDYKEHFSLAFASKTMQWYYIDNHLPRIYQIYFFIKDGLFAILKELIKTIVT